MVNCYSKKKKKRWEYWVHDIGVLVRCQRNWYTSIVLLQIADGRSFEPENRIYLNNILMHTTYHTTTNAYSIWNTTFTSNLI